MKKRILTACVAALLFLGLTSCGENPDPECYPSSSTVHHYHHDTGTKYKAPKSAPKYKAPSYSGRKR